MEMCKRHPDVPCRALECGLCRNRDESEKLGLLTPEELGNFPERDQSGVPMTPREPNPASSSLTDSQARESAEIAGTCSDGVKCGFAGVYCDDCPNAPCTDSLHSGDNSLEKTGMKFDGEKLRADLLLDMPRALDEVIDVLTQGAAKYAPGNWAHVDDAERRYKAASMRHELALALHGPHDDETGCHHLAHKICCDLFRLELALRESGQ